MGVTVDPESLGGGATEFVRAADALLGHVTSVEDLNALRTAFAGAGEAAWRGVEMRLADLMGRLEAAQRQTEDTGTVLRTGAVGYPVIDQNNGDSMRM